MRRFLSRRDESSQAKSESSLMISTSTALSIRRYFGAGGASIAGRPIDLLEGRPDEPVSDRSSTTCFLRDELSPEGGEVFGGESANFV